MAVILQTPIINAITPFDPSYDQTIDFYYTDNQPYKNRIVISDNANGNIVYDKITDSMTLYTIIPKNILTPGQYLVQIQVFDFDNNCSNLSDPVLFYCYTAPVFQFSNISNGNIYRNASICLSLNYSQLEDEKLKDFQYFIYSHDKVELSSSDVIYSSAPTNYTFYGLKNNETYFFRAMGETVHGMKLDTEYIEVNIRYNVIPSNVGLQVENNYKNGYIQITSNIISIGYELKNDNYKIEDGCLTLWGDNYLKYNEGFDIDGDFSLFIEAKKLPVKKFLTTNDDNISLSIINVCGSYYCRLKIKNSSAVYCVSLPKARLCTDNEVFIVTDNDEQIEIVNTSYDDDEFVVFEVKHINGAYSLNAYYKSERLEG